MKPNWIEIYRVIVKNWRATIGSLFALVLAWLVVLEQVTFQTAGAALLIMYVGGYVNRRIDPFGAFKKGGDDVPNT